MNRDELLVRDVEDAMAGQSQFLPLADGRMAILWNSGKALRLRIVEEDDIIEMGFSPGEGVVTETPR